MKKKLGTATIDYAGAVAFIKKENKLQRFKNFCRRRGITDGLKNEQAVKAFVAQFVPGLIKGSEARKKHLQTIPYQQKSYLLGENSKRVSMLPGHYGANQ